MTEPDWVLTGNPNVSTELLMRRSSNGTLSLVDDENPIQSSIVGQGGESATVGPFGELLTGIKVDDISVQFQYGQLNTAFDMKNPITTGDGNVSVKTNLLSAESASSGTALVETKRTIRYRPGMSGYIDFTAMFTGTGMAEIGGFDSRDGFLIKYDNGSLQFGYRRDGTDFFEDVDSSGIDLSKLNIYRILYGYLGSADPVLLVKDPNYRVLKRIRTAGVLDRTHVSNPVFPISVYAENGAEVKCGSMAGGVLDGGPDVDTRVFSFPFEPLADGTALEQGNVNLVGTDVTTAVIFRMRDTYQTEINKVAAKLLQWNTSVRPPASGDGTVLFQLIAGNVDTITFSAAPTYSQIDTDNSTVEYDHTAGTGASVEYVSGGRVILQSQQFYSAGQGNSSSNGSLSNIDSEKLGSTGRAGDIFVLLIKDVDGNGVTAGSSFIWEELF